MIAPPPLPNLCDVCMRAGAEQLLPDRSDTEPWYYQVLCTVCLDALLGAFPLHPAALRRREITGRLSIGEVGRWRRRGVARRSRALSSLGC